MSRATPRPSHRLPPRRARLLLSALEDRLAPAVVAVLNTNNAGPGSLRQAILDTNAAAGADVITFDPATFSTPQTINLSTANATGIAGTALTITGDLTIAGPGANLLTVRRDPAAGIPLRSFAVFVAGKPGDVTFSGLTIAGGSTAANTVGGGVLVNDDFVTIRDCVLTGNTASQGGAISVQANGRLTILNSTVGGNATTASAGGGIIIGGAAELVMRNCTVSGNSAFTNGGALAFYGNNTFLIENSTISGNTANNTAAANTSGGGGLFVYGTPQGPGWIIRNSTIANNTAATAATRGGGILLGANAAAAGGSLIVQNSTITGNTANGGGGGGISRPFGASTINLTSTVVADNVDATAAAPDVQSAGAVNVNFSLVRDAAGFTPSATSANNLAAGTDPLLGPLQPNGGPVETRLPLAGSPLVNAGSNPSAGANLSAFVTDARGTDARGPGFSRNIGPTDIGAAEANPTGLSATAAGPDVTANGGTTYQFTVTYTTPTGTTLNAATLGADDVTVTGPGGTFTQGATFVSVAGNVATYQITAPGGTFDAADYGAYSVVVNASAVADSTGAFIPAGAAGRVRFPTPATFTVTTLADTVTAGTPDAGTLRRAIFDANTRIFANDVIAFQAGLTGTIALTNGQLTFVDPAVVTGPGATVLTVSGNNATRVMRTVGPSVIAVTISGLTLTGGNSVGTTAAANGSGLFVGNEDVTLDGVVINGNVVPTVAGGGVAVLNGRLTVRNSTVSGNSAGTFGAGIYQNGGDLTVENSTVSGNTGGAGAQGGGVLFYGTPPTGVTIRNSTIANNSVGISGGGVAIANVNGTVTIQNSTIAMNTAGGTGAGQGGGGLARTDAVNAGNIGPGTVTLVSTVVANNTNTAAPDVNGPVTASTSLIRDQTGATVTQGPGGPNLAAGTDPLFDPAGLANNGGPTPTIGLQAGSPLLNVGSNPAALANDQRGPGFARTSGTGTDIGAFERQVPTAPRVVGLPVIGDGITSTQRSRVTQIVLTFTVPVTFAGVPAAAFTLTRVGGGAVGGFTVTVSGGGTIVTIGNFTGANTEFGSLVDGRYTLTAIASQITAGGLQLDGNGDGTGGDDYTLASAGATGVFRFFGDSNGDARTDVLDLALFAGTYQKVLGDTGYLAYFDFNNDNRVDIGDLGAFVQRYQQQLP